MKLLLSILLCLTLTSSFQKTPKILIIGDSISLGYTPFVQSILADKATVFHNPGNAQHTGTGLEKIREWIGDKTWDVVQFNWGLWDLCYRHPDAKNQGNRDKKHGKITYTLDEYAANLDAIVTIIKSLTKAKLVFVTTSYVPEKEAGRFKDDAERYNEVAKKIMAKHAIAINDIYAQSAVIHNDFGNGDDNVHFSKKGSEKLGIIVANFLKTVLE